MSVLEDKRKIIDDIDEKIAKLFQKRMVTVEKIAQYKIKNKLEVFDKCREEEILLKNIEFIENEDQKNLYKEFLKKLLNLSCDYQKSIINKDVIGYPGITGAFSHIAALTIFPHHKMKSFTTFYEVVKAVEDGSLNYGIIPYENSFTGEVGEVSDLLKNSDVYINKTLDLKIDQNLLGIKGAKLSDIRQVYSHPQAISQSSIFLKGMNVEIISYPNTAIAAKYVSESNDIRKGAIASKETAILYNLDIIEPNINTSENNTTRFIVVSKNFIEEGDYFQLLVTVKNKPGTLANVINIIAKRGFNMLNIKSHAIPKEPWSYYFHIELEGNLKNKNSKELLLELKEYCIEIKLLGGYIKIK
ncbi:MAG: chorismate mutase [Fusobacteriaceae bacterium]|jgi:chorismate mutase/prephenate dehydratase|nr:chorismate mutase [Fusobacteriaceae bacterium]